MQRRVATSSSAGGPSGSINSSSDGAGGVPALSRLHRQNQHHNSSHKNKLKLNPVIIILIGLALGVLLLFVSWWFFPDQVVRMEHGAEYVGQQMAQKALRAEHNVEDWIQHSGGAGKQQPGSSDAASAAMLAQSSSSQWVDGEKKLKKKLMELYEKQQQGELLGVPVLTRWLGDDFPAWVTPDMDEQKWRNDVAAKYKEMREEEERWKVKMEKIILQRERDLGITTA